MSSQKQNTGNPGGNGSANAGPSTAFSLATLAAAPLGPAYNPVGEWEANVSRRDNLVTDFLFESATVDKSTIKKSTQKKSTPKKRAAPAQEKSSDKKSTDKKPKTK
ncbi:hypothetical protein V496_07709 [Pseudogymnoascus sp. VKM F-4515 (FW-2607)]|nr:hypothetical protein V496_07709 [Pseudogymnoascus sp. VKM F-4515 (FW-2607)]KFY78863.1 hypothetical protein V498_09032 [Pseudogymnoascus sp. VKM F-4517 (FW-2822)]